VTADFGDPYSNEVVSSNFLQTFDEFVNDVAATRHHFLSYLIDTTRTTVDRNGMIRMDFVNQTVDVELLSKVARLVRIWMAESEQLHKVNKILAPEVSGLPIGSLVSSAFRTNMILARKVKSRSQPDDFLTSSYSVPSATKLGEEYYFTVKRNTLARGDTVLVSDDFRRTGRTIDAMCDLVKQAEAHLAGALVIVDKSYEKDYGDSEPNYRFGAALGVERFEPANGKARLYMNRILMIPCDPSRTYLDVQLTR
jgi:adenine/guanine phosphoribosyltransferase-like PRPP-binding protein